MQMTRGLGIIMTLMVVAAFDLLAVQASSARPSCKLERSHVVAAASRALVIELEGRAYDGMPTYLSCDRRTGRLRRLSNPPYGYLEDIRAAGRFVAFDTVSDHGKGNTQTVRVLDVLHPKRPRLYASYRGARVPRDGVVGTALGGLVLDADGSVAWIATHPRSGLREVWYASWNGAPRLLDHATDIVNGSLAIGENDVFWLRDDGAHSARR